MSTDQPQTTRPKSSAQVRERLFGVLIEVVHRMAPPDDQRAIDTLLAEWAAASKREEDAYYD